MIETLVDIIVPTFNQEKYISQALQSILEQQCNFGYRILIGEDCSTDGTLAICKEFKEKNPEKIVLLDNKENLGLAKNYRKLFGECCAKYIAILEGDDYWIDKLKLQKQVDLLEARGEVGLVHTASQTLFENGELKRNHLNMSKELLEGDLYVSLLIKRNTVSPMTVCFRKSLFDQFVDFNYFVQNNFKTIDYPIWLELAQHSKFAYIGDITAVYRNLSSSVSHKGSFEQRISFFETAESTKLYYLQKYPVEGVTETTLLSNLYKTHFYLACEFNRFDKAREIRNKLSLTDIESLLQYFFSSNIVLFRLFSFWISMKPMLSNIKQLFYKIAQKYT